MPHAVTHVLVPIVLVDLYRNYWYKAKKRFHLHYILIAGLAGLLPDIDVVIYWILKLFTNISVSQVHRTFTHTLFFPLIFLILGLLTKNKTIKIYKDKLKLNWVFYMIAIGTFIHLILDMILVGTIKPLYPFSYYEIGFNLIKNTLEGTLMPGIDAILLFIWLIHLELRHKISDYI